MSNIASYICVCCFIEPFVEIQVSRVMLFNKFEEQEIRVYCKKRDDDSLKAAQE